MAPSFENSEHKETCVPNLSGQRGGQKRQAILPHLYNVVLTVTLAVLCCPLYRIYIECGVLLEVPSLLPVANTHQVIMEFQLRDVLSVMHRTTIHDSIAHEPHSNGPDSHDWLVWGAVAMMHHTVRLSPS
jgi:hypothetical protein